MLLGAVPKSNLLYYPLGQGDTAGLVFGSCLQAHSHFPDLRKGAISHQLELSLREHINKRSILPAVQPLEPLLSVSTQRFGSNFCDSLIAPSLHALSVAHLNHLPALHYYYPAGLVL